LLEELVCVGSWSPDVAKVEVESGTCVVAAADVVEVV